MFRKIISNLPFSPALVGQLSFYAKRLRKEETTRRLGLIFLSLAIAVQFLAVFQPSESANASSDTDMVTGGISSLNDYLSAYDSNTRHLRDTMNFIGITRSEIAAAKYDAWRAEDRYSWGYAPRFSYSQGERRFNVTNKFGGTVVTTVYARPLRLWGSYNMRVTGWVGYSKTMGWFGIMKSCGNLVTTKLPVIKAPCPGESSIPIDDRSCKPNIVKNKTATNTSQGFIKASSTTAQPGDQISYTITIENTGLQSTTVELQERLADVLEYSTLIDRGGGTFDKTTKILSWADVTLKPKTKQTRTFVVRVLEEIPATAKGSTDPTSFDCNMLNTFGNSISINVSCPTPKTVETVTNELPQTGPGENLLFAGVVFAVTVYFYARSRQERKEVHLIRKDIGMGTI